MLILCDKRIPGEYLRGLSARIPQMEILSFGGPVDKDIELVYGSILCHPDIYFFQLDEKTLVHAPCVPAGILSKLRERGVDLIKGETDPFGKYPDTVKYNACRIGGHFIHNIKHTDPVVLEQVRIRGLQTIDVQQGYTRCSMVPIGANAAITSDKDIYEKVKTAGIRVLCLEPGEIELPGEKHGFLGGTSGALGSKVMFLGDLDKYDAAPAIREFIRECGCESFEVDGKGLFDGGGLLVFK